MEVFWARSGRTAWERLMESGGEGGGCHRSWESSGTETKWLLIKIRKAVEGSWTLT